MLFIFPGKLKKYTNSLDLAQRLAYILYKGSDSKYFLSFVGHVFSVVCSCF